MKILIKIYFDINLINLNHQSIVDDIKNRIIDKEKTKIVYNNNSHSNIPEFINSELNDIEWDLYIPIIYNSYIPTKGFDNDIRNIYNKNFPNLDGVLWLNNNFEKNVCTLPVIGKNYYNKFGYVYNISYKQNFFQKEFTEILKLKNKYFYVEDNLFEERLNIDDDFQTYNFRKKLNFCQTDVVKNIIKDEKLNDKNVIKNENINDKKVELKQNLNKKSILNSFTNNVYVLNLKRRTDRLEHMKKEMEKIKVDYKVFESVDGQMLQIDNHLKGMTGAVRSHVGVIKDAINNKYDKIAVFEDDVIFCDDFEDRFNYYIKIIPDDWDIMYLGCHFHSCKSPILVENNVYKVSCAYGCFAMILNNRNKLFETIIDNVTENMPYDNFINTLLPKINAYVFLPFFVKTLKTISDISTNKEAFSYDVVDKHFKNIFEIENNELKKEENVKNKEENVIKPQPPQNSYIYMIENMQRRTNQSMCEDYVRSGYPFIILFNSRVIFDSDTTDKINLAFFDDHFTLYGRRFSYQGMIIKRK